MIALVIDALADPLVGSLSDGFRSRFGRRHPFMYASVIPLGVAIALTFARTTVVAERPVCMERSAVVMWRYVVGWIGGLAFVLSVWTFVFPSTPEFTPGHLNPHGYRLFAPLLGAVVAIAAFLTTHLTRREIPFMLQPATNAEDPS